MQARDIYGGLIVQQGPAPFVPAFVMRAPPDGFTGRVEDLEQITDRINPAAAPETGAAVSVLSGMGGVGKTALVLRAGEEALAGEWFCAHLFVDLHGYTPHTSPLSGFAALEVLLRQVTTDPERIPPTSDERVDFFRNALESLRRDDELQRPVLVVADNVQSLDQVELLRPGAGGHRLVVTTRGRLVIDGHQPQPLRPLPVERAAALIAARLGTNDPRSGDTGGLTGLADRCGCLPLALKIAAARLASQPHLLPGELTQHLIDTKNFNDGRDDLGAVFTVSLDQLPRETVEVFALLGSHTGPDISTTAAAALCGLEPGRVKVVLGELAAAHLLTDHPAERWSTHDLLADYARHLPLSTQENEQDPRARALLRLLDFYTASAAVADQHVRALDGDDQPVGFADAGQARAWLEAEHDNLIAAVHAAHRIGHAHTAVHLPTHLAGHLELKRRSDDAITVHTLARDTARELGDAPGEATAWISLGGSLRQANRFADALEAYTRARGIFRRLGDSRGEAHAWNGYGGAVRQMDRFADALEAHSRARGIFRSLGDPHGEAMAWHDLGWARQGVRWFSGAVSAQGRARDIFQYLGDVRGEAGACDGLGQALGEMERHEEAVEALTRARDLYQRSGDAHGSATAWSNLGTILRAMNRLPDALEANEHYLDYCRQRGDDHDEAEAWMLIGRTRQKMKQTRKAREAYERSERRFRDARDEESAVAVQGELTPLYKVLWRLWRS